MKKTILALVLTLIMIFSFAFSVNASNTTSFAVSSATVDRGATVTIDVTVNSMPEVNSLGLQVLSYDNAVLELVSGTWNTANMNSPMLVQNLNVSNGTAGTGWGAPVTFTGNIFSITFKVKDNAAIGTTSVVVKLLPKNNKVSTPLAEVQATATITVACSHSNTENRIEVPATCNLPGTAAGVYCLGCNTYISGGTPILPTGQHADADGKWEISETEHWHTCSCGEILDKVAHSGGTATCVAKAQCAVCLAAYGEINAANHKVSAQQIADDQYLVAGSGANCKEYKKYYYECVDCHAATAELWTSTVLGEHNYGTLVDAKPEVHTPDKLESAVAAHYLCSVCQVYFTDAKVATTIEALTGATPVHTFGAFKADAQNHWKECSCTKKDSEGKHIFDNDADMICDTCSYDRSCTHPQALVHVNAKPANCTENGNVEYWYCVDCLAKFDSATATNKLADVSVPALGHIFDTNYTYADGYHWKACTGIGCTEKSENAACDSAVKATCQQKAVCDTCGNTYTDFAPHDFAAEYTTEAGKHWRACQTANCVAVIDEANCSGGTATCYKLAECATCNKEYGALTAHVISTTWDYKDATGHAYACTNTGCTYHEATQAHVDDAAGEKCTVCGYVYHTCGVDMTYVPAVIGSCLVKGRQAYYICSCGKFYYDMAATKILNDLAEIEAYGGHISIVVPAVPATCTTNGSTEAMSCAVCRIQFVVAQTIPAKGHEWSEWTTTIAPTDFVTGTKTRTCDVCKAVETASIPALGHEHTPVELPAVAPTCAETGLTAGSKCAACGEILVAQETVPAIEHTVEHVAAKAATATEAGNVEYWYCTACEVIWLDEQRTVTTTKEDVAIPAIGEETVIVTPPAEEGGESEVIITGTGIVAGTKVEVTYKPAEEFANVSVTVEGKQGSILQVADITLKLEGNNVQPDGSVQVKLLINEALRTLENLEVVHIAADGTVEVMNAVREGNYLVFDAKHFSNYAVVELKEEVITEPDETTQTPEETTQAPEETTEVPEETTAAPEETTQAPEDITVPEETTEAPVETTEAPEETTVAPEETTSPEVPSTGDNAIFFIVALIAFSAIFAFAVALGKKRNDN